MIKNNIENKLSFISSEYFKASHLKQNEKKIIFSKVIMLLKNNKLQLQKIIMSEVKLTQADAKKEIDRAIDTFSTGIKFVDAIKTKKKNIDHKIIIEKRIARGPLLIITPFSSPLSSPAHKIVCGLIAGTSILFKPSKLSQKTGIFLYKLLKQVTNNRYIDILINSSKKQLNKILKDERIGIISFTGSYENGKKIIKIGGVKKYHMELSGGNSSIVFTPDFDEYNKKLLGKVVSGIIAKNGQRCISIKHIFIPQSKSFFIENLKDELIKIKKRLKKNKKEGMRLFLGPQINEGHIKLTEGKITDIISGQKNTPIIAFEKNKDFMYPAIYSLDNFSSKNIKNNLSYDLTGPIVFINFYKSDIEYKLIMDALKNDYIRSGLQISFFTKDKKSIDNIVKDLIWGAIIFNNIPTYRSDYMSFGGFGRAGLGKEGFIETINMYTDVQSIVINN